MLCIAGLPPSDFTICKMLLTQCAVCATELGLSLGKKCGRCSTRYCGAECQKQHWEEGGHDQLCKKIKKAGGAEQYNANNKYAESVAIAVDKCAEDTKGKTCYICMEAVHRRTKEGLVGSEMCIRDSSAPSAPPNLAYPWARNAAAAARATAGPNARCSTGRTAGTISSANQ